ncbi:NAD(P)/FAD-dependent oxidoreductase [uncultured Christiangramia sp.]|uniref:phytoene desaturase family protein n=1 Tax=uncultured Christiangramia sp. TaxID=503836 RepID=UPI0026282178|nr:NAD(P)/FAD-dependent oxidoreductase [uncultured Christiangramia sp.]
MEYDAVIIGSGPNGLAAGIELAKNNFKVLICEAKESIGGGLRSGEIISPGFNHDICAAVHPTARLSPFFKQLPLDKYGLKWIHPDYSLAHPLENQKAVLLKRSILDTAADMGADNKSWVDLFTPLINNGDDLLFDTLGPLRIPRNKRTFLNFGIKGLLSANYFSDLFFKEERAKALFMGCAAHSILSLDKFFTAAVGMMFVVQGHLTNWPVVEGGSVNLIRAMSKYFQSLGGEIQTSMHIRRYEDLPISKTYLFDTDPRQLAEISKNQLPKNYLKKLSKYSYGPGVFKLDFTLSDSIPWNDENCLKASTVHVGGSANEIIVSEKNMWNGLHSEKPFIIVCQQSEFDSSRAPQGMHTGYAYCHVPHKSTKDMSKIIIDQIERFAPGFKKNVIALRKSNTADLATYNPNYYGGAITGGTADFTQLFTRPVMKLDPYSTPNSKIFICSASTPPGGGTHGMCGYYAARSVIKRLKR